MKLAIPISLLLLGATFAAGEEVEEAVPLLDVEAILPEDEMVPFEIEEPKIDPGIEVAERAISASKQFAISGGEKGQRGSLALEAEELRLRFHQLLGIENPPVVVPIEVVLHGKVGDEPRKRPLAYQLRFTKDTFLLEIHVDLSRGIDRDRMDRAILSGLLYQRSLIEVKPGELDSRLLVPVWLVEGLREAEKWRAGKGDRKVYEGVFKQEGLFNLDQLMSMHEAGFERLDGASRVAFRALSGAMVMALLEQPRGQEAFVSFCNEVARYDGEMPILLRQHFPELNLSEQSLAKWWALTLAKLADAPLTESLGIAETEKLLSEALRIRFRTDEGNLESVPLEQWEGVLLDEETDRFAAIRPAQEALNHLSYRSFPSYRPLILDYHQILIDWASFRNLGDLDGKLGELSESRTLMLGRSIRARDFLDFKEIAEATELSGSFDDYIRLIDELKERPRPERKDPISRYLDTLERIYERPDRTKR
ncbi:hypothetical protein ACFQY0_08080 [Haloferula chungangensis]|uniref:Uncharacterized protein n=1 Tax=Haloferula chungangensis TaxID=1048331 RepID=A0ABW2L481_9BACT